MNLLELMKADYVKDRYQLDKLVIMKPVFEGESFIAIGVIDDGGIQLFFASGKSEAAALVNLSVIVNGDCNVDVSEHIVNYYESLEKYQGVDSDELFKFADELIKKFRIGENISSSQAIQLREEIELIRNEYSYSDITVINSGAISDWFKHYGYETQYSPLLTDNNDTCFICDKPANSSGFCRSCYEDQMSI